MSGSCTSPEESVQDKFIPMRQNNGTNNIVRNLNKIQKIGGVEPDQWGEKKVTSATGNFMIKAEKGQIKEIENKLENKLKSPNAKKLFLYYCHKVAVENKTQITINFDEFFEELRGDQTNWQTVATLIEELNVLKKIRITKFKCRINGEEGYYEDTFLIKPEVFRTKGSENRKGYIRYITITGGAWAQSLIDSDQYAYIPKELFKMDKLELDLGYNILIRCRIERKYMVDKEKKQFTLPVERLIEGANLHTAKGVNKEIDRIEAVLNKLEDLNWFTWEYENKTREDLPSRNILSKYKQFKIKFDITDKELAKIYNLE